MLIMSQIGEIRRMKEVEGYSIFEDDGSLKNVFSRELFVALKRVSP